MCLLIVHRRSILFVFFQSCSKLPLISFVFVFCSFLKRQLFISLNDPSFVLFWTKPFNVMIKLTITIIIIMIRVYVKIWNNIKIISLNDTMNIKIKITSRSAWRSESLFRSLSTSGSELALMSQFTTRSL